MYFRSQIHIFITSLLSSLILLAKINPWFIGILVLGGYLPYEEVARRVFPKKQQKEIRKWKNLERCEKKKFVHYSRC